MDNELKKKWISALRSGEYKQGRGILRETIGDTDYFCCLGVLHDKAHPEGWTQQEYDEITSWVHVLDFNDYKAVSAYSFGKTVLNHYGLNEKASHNLTKMNDGTTQDNLRIDPDLASSFEEIADWIEENV